MWDKDFDKDVARTKNRPLASGRISPFQALVFLGCQLSVGLGVLLQLNDYCLALGASSLALVVSYPFFKRVTHYPQVVLGLAFNWGALLGWAAVHESCDWSVVLPLYSAGVSWTMIYDTWYAHQDKEDDKKLGLKSTAIAWGNNTKKIASMYSVAMVSGLGISGYAAGLGNSISFNIGLAATAAHLSWQIYSADLNDRINLNNKFRSNNILGGVIFACIFGGNIML
jgi:4-hydroxybenzoate polyprenyltransferase